MIPGKPLTPPGPWNYAAGGERRWQKGFVLGCLGYFSRLEKMGKLFYWRPLSTDYTVGPLVSLLSLQEKRTNSNESVHALL